MKKIYVLLVAVIMVMTLSGCGTQNGEDYSGYEGRTFEGTSPWGGQLTVVVDEVNGDTLSYQFSESCSEGWGYHIEMETTLKEGKGDFSIDEKNDNQKAEYSGTIELKDDTVVITYKDGQKTTISENGDSGYEAVGALDDEKKTVVLK